MAYRHFFFLTSSPALKSHSILFLIQLFVTHIQRCEIARRLAAASTYNGRILHGGLAVTLGQEPSHSAVIMTLDIGPGSTNNASCAHKARDDNQHCHIRVLILHYQVLSDSPGGAISTNKMSKLAYYSYVYCSVYIGHLDLMCFVDVYNGISCSLRSSSLQQCRH